MVRAPDSGPEGLGSMLLSGNTLGAQTEYVLVKSVGPKVVWAESRVASWCLAHKSLSSYWQKTIVIDMHNLLLVSISYQSGSFERRDKDGKSLVLCPGYMLDALKLPNQDPRVSGESLHTCMAMHCPDGTQKPFLLTNSGRFWSIASFKRSSC
ncbi:hypothetical protein TNCV_2098431 [Trichonephila clavipes]|nr:hypothetical protein TNCV_2098431 [Trichonephila clavipes]